MVEVDGRHYDSWDSAPDLGSIKCVSTEANGRRHYQCLSADVSKLPTYAMTGSDCVVCDTGDVYIKHEEDWRKL
jgi:hypothetical protein